MTRSRDQKVLISLLTVYVATVACTANASAEASLTDKIEAIVDAKEEFGLFSGSVLVADQGEII